MAIDDRLAQAKAQVESDERQRSVGIEIAEQLLRLSQTIPLLKQFIPTFIEPVQAIFEMFQKRRLENVTYLVDIIIQEVQKQGAVLDRLSDGHRKFIEEEWPNLVLDGVTKAQQVRAKQRVKRIGEILATAYFEGDKQSPDLAEEMMRVAMGLDDVDVKVLAWLCEGMRSTYNCRSKTIDFEVANDFWHDVEEKIRSGFGKGPTLPSAMTIGHVLTCCAKLQAFGLVLQVRQNESKTFAILPYSPLNQGYEFLEYIRNQV